MIRKLLATTAIATLISTAAYAQETTAPAPAAPAPVELGTDATKAPMTAAQANLASMMIGETVYNGTGENAENIGEVNDMVVSPEGQIETVVIGVGGFLGIGEKNVGLNFKDFTWADKDGDRWLVVAATKEQLEAQPEFDRTPFVPATPADSVASAPATGTEAVPAAPANDQMAAEPAAPADQTAETVAPADPAMTDQTQTAAIDRSTLTELPAGQLTAENLVGTEVYGMNDANIGEISDVVLNADGQNDAVIIDVGGFLGIGAKSVAVGMDKLQFLTDANGNRYLYTSFTKEQLEAQAAYDPATWAEQRDQQRMMIQ